jgi:hypothetical protein
VVQLDRRLRQNRFSFMDPNTLAALRTTHELYCQLTGQKLTLRFDRERLWYEFLRSGFSAQDLKSVVAYLQKEIRASRRNVGALKLSNHPTFCNSIASRKISISAKSDCAPARHRPTPLAPHSLIRYHLRLLNFRTCVRRPKRPLPVCAGNSEKLPTLNYQTLKTSENPDSAPKLSANS